MRTPLHVSREVIAQFVDEYIREVKHIRRAELREAIIHRHQEKGKSVPEGEEMEAHIDVLELLLETGNAEPFTILQLFDELEFPPETESQPKSSQILISLKKRFARPEPQVVDDATLDQYRFAVTGKIMIRCRRCRRGYNRTKQEFMQDRFLQRMLLGHQVTCPYCHTGQVRLSGVTAVPRE